MNLTKNFTLEELTFSAEATRRGLDNTPSEEIIKNLKVLALKLEEVREFLGHVPIRVLSGYRSPDVNFVVKGSKNSQHMQGMAADFIAPSFGSPYDIAAKLADSRLIFDQLIHEFGTWVHIGYANGGARKEIMTICKPNLGYRRGIFRCS